MRTISSTLPVAAMLVALLALAPPAAAQRTVPPGNSEADQYTETVPGGGGDNTIDRGEGAQEVESGDDGGTYLSAAELQELQSLGEDGAAAAAVAAATAPEGLGRGEGSGPGGKRGESGTAGANGDGGVPAPAGAGTAEKAAEEGLGWLLWAILAVVALSGLVFAILHRRASKAT